MISCGQPKRLANMLHNVPFYGASTYVARSNNYCAEPLESENVSSFVKWPAAKTWYDAKINNRGWWCANRKFMSHLQSFFLQFPRKSYYLFVDDDSVINTKNLFKLLKHMKELDPPTLYAGHMLKSMVRTSKFDNFIGSGGGVLLKGDHLRQLVFSGTLERFRFEQRNGKYSWWPLDWVLAEALYEIGIYAQLNRAFQQFSGEPFVQCEDACNSAMVVCHPYKTIATQASIYDSWTQVPYTDDTFYDTCSTNIAPSDYTQASCKEDNYVTRDICRASVAPTPRRKVAPTPRRKDAPTPRRKDVRQMDRDVRSTNN